MKSNFIFSLVENSSYPEAPYSPDQPYPELKDLFTKFDTNNKIYATVRKLLMEMGYDSVNIGTPTWNPFRGLIKSNGTVVIKPNLVLQENKKNYGKNCLMTNISLIRPLLDYLFILQLTDNIHFRTVVADVPVQGADFEKILEQTGLKKLQEFYLKEHSFKIEVLDLRHKIVKVDNTGFYAQVRVKGDPLGYKKIHIENSFLNDIAKDYRKFGAPGYGLKDTYSEIESSGEHYYHIPNTILAADLFINVPKLKTHKKAGITAAMKNLIGINGEKAWIPHFRRGSIKNGGDEFDDNQVIIKTITTRALAFLRNRSRILWNFARTINNTIIKRYFRKDLKQTDHLTDFEKKALFLVDGDWYGNDTLWRPILDLNFLLYFYDKNGIRLNHKARNYICITDGIISGEGDGPLDADPKKTDIIAISENPVINDLCLTRIMGFDWKKIPQIYNSVSLKEIFRFDGTYDNFRIIQISDYYANSQIKFDELPNLHFLPPPGWVGNIELDS